MVTTFSFKSFSRQRWQEYNGRYICVRYRGYDVNNKATVYQDRGRTMRMLDSSNLRSPPSPKIKDRKRCNATTVVHKAVGDTTMSLYLSTQFSLIWSREKTRTCLASRIFKQNKKRYKNKWIEFSVAVISVSIVAALEFFSPPVWLSLQRHFTENTFFGMDIEHQKIYVSGWWIEGLACPLANVHQSPPNKAKSLLKRQRRRALLWHLNTLRTLMNQTWC